MAFEGPLLYSQKHTIGPDSQPVEFIPVLHILFLYLSFPCHILGSWLLDSHRGGLD
jgi:hypothetical protein